MSELGLPTNFELFAVGVGFLSAALMTYLGVPLLVQLPVFFAVVGVVILLAYRLSSRESGPPPTAFTPLSLRGKVGRVVEADDSGYVVKVDGEEWRAESSEPLAVGDEVVVVDVVGVRLKVQKRR